MLHWTPLTFQYEVYVIMVGDLYYELLGAVWKNFVENFFALMFIKNGL